MALPEIIGIVVAPLIGTTVSKGVAFFPTLDEHGAVTVPFSSIQNRGTRKIRSETDVFSAAIGGTERSRTRPLIDELERRPPPPLIFSVRELATRVQGRTDAGTPPRAPHRKHAEGAAP